MTERIIVAISGASGVIYGIRALQVLRAMPNIETHLVVSSAAKQTIAAETNWAVKDVERSRTRCTTPREIGAAMASGSFAVRGMIVIPCSIKTLSAIANSYSADLIARAADVTLKEGRPLMLVVRETPLHLGHLRLMTRAAEIGAMIFPPVPAFYRQPQTIDEIIDDTVGRVLARIGLDNDLYRAGKNRCVAMELSDRVARFYRRAKHADARDDERRRLAARVRSVLHVRRRRVLFSLRSQNAAHSKPRAPSRTSSATIHGASQGWQDIRGVQIGGAAARVDDLRNARARSRSTSPSTRSCAGFCRSVEMLGHAHEIFGVVDLYKLTPRWLRWIDNTQGFG